MTIPNFMTVFTTVIKHQVWFVTFPALLYQNSLPLLFSSMFFCFLFPRMFYNPGHFLMVSISGALNPTSGSFCRSAKLARYCYPHNDMALQKLLNYNPQQPQSACRIIRDAGIIIWKFLQSLSFSTLGGNSDG